MPSTSGCPDAKKSIASLATASSRSNVPTKDDPAGNGVPCCAEAKTGKMLWEEGRLSGKDVTASPLLAGDEMLVITESVRADALCSERRCVARGGALFRSGERLVALYEVQTGFFKSCLVDLSGRSQVTGFQMSGDLLGLDGIGADRHCVDAIALEDAMVCVIPFAALNELLKDSSALQRQFHKAMSREIVSNQAMMLTLGTMPAEGRIAAFVLDLSQRLFERGFSPSALVLRMTREEIGSFLGLQIETVSRGFSKLHIDGVLEIRNRNVDVLDPVALRRIAHGAPRPARLTLSVAF